MATIDRPRPSSTERIVAVGDASVATNVVVVVAASCPLGAGSSLRQKNSIQATAATAIMATNTAKMGNDLACFGRTLSSSCNAAWAAARRSSSLAVSLDCGGTVAGGSAGEGAAGSATRDGCPRASGGGWGCGGGCRVSELRGRVAAKSASRLLKGVFSGTRLPAGSDVSGSSVGGAAGGASRTAAGGAASGASSVFWDRCCGSTGDASTTSAVSMTSGGGGGGGGGDVGATVSGVRMRERSSSPTERGAPGEDSGRSFSGRTRGASTSELTFSFSCASSSRLADNSSKRRLRVGSSCASRSSAHKSCCLSVSATNRATSSPLSATGAPLCSSTATPSAVGLVAHR